MIRSLKDFLYPSFPEPQAISPGSEMMLRWESHGNLSFPFLFSYLFSNLHSMRKVENVSMFEESCQK